MTLSGKISENCVEWSFIFFMHFISIRNKERKQRETCRKIGEDDRAKRTRKNRNQLFISNWDFPPAILEQIFLKDMEKLEDFLKLKPFQIKNINWSKKRGNDYPNTISSKNIYISRLRKNVFVFFFFVCSPQGKK
jgi:hypothetical protein